MSGPDSRRGFLRGLATLPLVGGSVTLVGAPSRAAVPITGGMVASYLAWLAFEQRFVAWNARCEHFIPCINPGSGFHDFHESAERTVRAAMLRAPVVLATVGCRLTTPEADEAWAAHGPENWRFPLQR